MRSWGGCQLQSMLWLMGPSMRRHPASLCYWHYGIQVRALVAIPILILAEGTVEKTIRSVVSQFSESGIVDGTQAEPYRCALEKARQISNSLAAQVVLLVLTGTGVFFGIGTSMLAGKSSPWLLLAQNGRQSLTFAGWWYVLVLLPLFSFLVLQWLWRWVVWAIFLRRVSKLKLKLVATHSDRCGGLLFLQTAPAAFAGFVFALSAVLASEWGHEVKFHGVDIYSFKGVLIGFVLMSYCDLRRPSVGVFRLSVANKTPGAKRI